MTDEQNKTSPDDEYQFPQDEYAVGKNHDEHIEMEVPSSASDDSIVGAQTQRGFIGKLADRARNMPEIKNKRIALVIIGVIFLLIIFHAIRSNEKSVPPEQPAPQAQAPIVQQPVQPVTPEAPVSDNMNTSLDALQADRTQAESKIHDLEGQVSDLQTSLTQSQTTTQQLQQSIASLTAQVQDLTEKLDKVIAEREPQRPKIVYHLRAVIPDRAWIISNSGETVSVSVGDHLDQYGKIESIDSVHGIIETSSGRKIQYGVNDV